MKLMIITTTVRFAHTTASFLNLKPTTSTTTIARFARTRASSLIIITIEMLNMVL